MVVYQAVKALPEPVASSAAAPAQGQEPAASPSLSRQPPQRAEAEATTPADLKPTKDVAQWPVKYDFEVSDGAFTPTYTDIAQLTVQAVSASGSSLPKWFHDEISVNCTLCEYAKQGKPHLRDLTAAGKPKTCNISAGTTQIAVRFWFARKSAPGGGNIRPVAETPWHVVDAVQSGAAYRLKAPLTQSMLVSLQIKPAKAVKPAKPSPPPKSGGKRPRDVDASPH